MAGDMPPSALELAMPTQQEVYAFFFLRAGLGRQMVSCITQDSFPFALWHRLSAPLLQHQRSTEITRFVAVSDSATFHCLTFYHNMIYLVVHLVA